MSASCSLAERAEVEVVAMVLVKWEGGVCGLVLVRCGRSGTTDIVCRVTAQDEMSLRPMCAAPGCDAAAAYKLVVLTQSCKRMNRCWAVILKEFRIKPVSYEVFRECKKTPQ